MREERGRGREEERVGGREEERRGKGFKFVIINVEDAKFNQC